MNEKNHFVLPSLILGMAIVLGLSIVGFVFYRVRMMENTLAVTGSAKQAIVSDSVKWVSVISRSVSINDLKGGYAGMESDRKAVFEFLKANGISENDVVINPVFVDEPFKYNSNMPREYNLRQVLEIRSSEVDKISALAKDLKPIIDLGVVFSTQSLEYYYSKLPETRISLLESATQDAKARAEKIASASGRKVGAIQSASMGAVQVLSPNSVDISDYGNYDTYSVNKEVMVTVRASFYLE